MGKKQEVVCMVEWYEVGTKTINVQVEKPLPSVGDIVQGWDVTPNKTKVKPGDTVILNVTVNWTQPHGFYVYFKVKGNAFGQPFETATPVFAQFSPCKFVVPVKVPDNASAGQYPITVTLLVGVETSGV